MKNVLLITVPMGGYEQALIETLKKKGFNVDFFYHAAKIPKFYLTPWQRLIRGIDRHSNYIEKIEEKIYRNHIEKLSEQYDYIFDFGGKARHTCLKLLKEKYQSTYLLYMWDDLKHSKYIQPNLPLFDKVFVFNQQEAIKYNYSYRPNFFINDYIYEDEDKIIDVFYRGTLREKSRTKILEKIESILSNYNIEITLHARGGYLRNFKKVHSKQYFNNKCDDGYLNVSQLSKKYKQSNVLLDIAYDNQIGLGLRPLEAIASNCKLITTNENIKNYDFYNPRNIFILNDSNIEKLTEFINLEKAIYSEEIRYKYSIDGFIDEIFDLTNR
jgi:hypothetical protein